jgi:Zn-dependent protease with chaperone function
MVMGALFLWIPYLLLRKSPQRWWLYTSLVSVPLLALVMLVQPVLIAPLFDDFGPMQDKALEAEILGLANRAGIDGGRVFEVISVFFLIVQPMAFAYSRHIEREADRFGLEITQDNYAMASALTLLHDENLVHPNPGPLYRLWRSGHPPIAERIEFANTYRPWETGQPLAYADYFRSP